MTSYSQTPNQAPPQSARIAAPDSDTEREADQMAERAMSGEPVPAATLGGDANALYRKCASCEAEEEELQLSAEGSLASVPASAPNRAASAVAGGGRPLPSDLRSYFEPRFGSDLSNVRVHTHGPASQAASAINARAYTRGHDIAFAPGRFRPETDAGRHLIAHELAHTLQNRPEMLARQEEPEEEETASEPLDIDTTHGGNTALIDEVTGPLQTEGNRIRGQVNRREIAPATEDDPQEEISEGTVNVEFDTEACEIVMPYRYGFRLEEEDDRYCRGDRMEGEPDIDAIADEFISAVNDRLNNQFKVRLNGCENDCADRDIPIRIDAQRDDANPDRTIDIIPRSGRGSSGDICAGESFAPTFAAHEAGHQILERGDEYRASAADRERVPEWGRDERVRGGNNLMGSSSQHGRFGVFHRRDFQHVLPFMRAAFPDCEPELIGIPQINIEVRILARGGFGAVNGRFAGRAGLSVGMGIPLTRDRAWLLALEAHGDYLATIDSNARRFVLAGIRAGIEYQFGGPYAYGRVFAGAGGGVSHELASEEFQPDGSILEQDPRTSGFAEGYAGIGLGASLGGGPQLHLNLQGTAGGEIGGGDQAAQWFNIGLGLGVRF